MSTYEALLAGEDGDGRTLVTVRREHDRAVLVLSDPARLNALSSTLVLQLGARLAELAAAPAVRAIVITGEGSAFSAGGDLEMIRAGSHAIRQATDPTDTTDAWRWIRREFGGIVRTIAGTDKAFLAAVNGPAAGVGLAFALACDIVVASERAVLVPAFGRLGLVPEVGMSWALTRRLGYQEAVALYVSGRHLDASEGLSLGLVQEVCRHEDLMTVADRWCARVAELPPHAFEMTKPLLRAAADSSWEHSLALEEYAEANCFSTAGLSRAATELSRQR